MPMFKALKACPNAAVIKPDMNKYAAVGRKVRAMMENLTPLVEPLSIDEAFMDLAGTEALHRASPAATLAALARRVEEELSITVSIGLSYNKFLAKIASDLDKPRGFAVIGRAEARTFLADKPVSLLWGVGKAMQERLGKDGIIRIGELARIDEAELVARYGKIGHRLSLCARGEDDRRVDPAGKVKSISSETTLDKDTAELDRLRPILWQLAETVARRMKKAGIVGKSVTLKLKTADFRLVTRSRRLKSATQSAEEMFQVAEPLLVREADGRDFRLIGIGAHDLVEAGQVAQGDLFGGFSPAESKVDKALDAVQGRSGENPLLFVQYENRHGNRYQLPARRPGESSQVSPLRRRSKIGEDGSDPPLEGVPIGPSRGCDVTCLDSPSRGVAPVRFIPAGRLKKPTAELRLRRRTVR